MKPPPLKSHRRRLNRILISVAAFVVLGLPTAHFIWGCWAEHRLNQTLANLHAAGEPVTPEQLVLASVPDAQNATLDYLAAEDSIDGKTPEWRLFDESLSREFQPPLTDEERKTVRAILSANATALADVVTARGKFAGAWVRLGAPASLMPLPSLSSTRRLCNLLRFAALDAHADADDQQAVNRLGDMLDEADAAEHRPTLVAHLVAIGCTALSSECISRMAPALHVGVNGVSRVQLVALMEQLRNEQAISDGSKLSWRTERLFGLSMLRGPVAGSFPAFGPGASPTTPADQANMMKLGYLVKPLLLGDARLYAEHMQGIMTACTSGDWPTAQRQMPTQLQYWLMRIRIST